MVEKRVEKNVDSDREAHFLTALAHLNQHRDRLSLLCPYLVEVYDHEMFSEKHHFYYEQLPGRDLLSLLDSFHTHTVPGDRKTVRMTTLAEWTIPDKLDEPYWLFYIRQVVEALEYIHMLGYVHGDIKPENIMLDRHGNAKVGVFKKNMTPIFQKNLFSKLWPPPKPYYRPC